MKNNFNINNHDKLDLIFIFILFIIENLLFNNYFL